MLPNTYPYNLIRDIYKDHENDDTHVSSVDLPNFYRTLTLIPESERIILISRYKEKKTFKASGQAIGQPNINSEQLIKKALRRLMRYGRHNYFAINPATGVGYTEHEIQPYIGELQLETGTENALIYAGFTAINEVRHLTEEELKQIRNFGEKYFQDFKKKMTTYEEKHGLTPIPKKTYPENLLHAIKTYSKNKNAAINQSALNHAFASLSQQQRQFITMKYKENKTVNEMHEAVGTPIAQINQTLRKGLLKMGETTGNTSKKTKKTKASTTGYVCQCKSNLFKVENRRIRYRSDTRIEPVLICANCNKTYNPGFTGTGGLNQK